MPTLNNILNDSAEVAVPTVDGDIRIQYYPSRTTQKVVAQLVQHGNTLTSSSDEEVINDAFYETNTLLLTLIKSWDLQDEEPCGKCTSCQEEDGSCERPKIVPFPLNADRMSELPMWLINDIAEALIKTRPNLKAGQKTTAKKR